MLYPIRRAQLEISGIPEGVMQPRLLRRITAETICLAAAALVLEPQI
jgi:hypothetical protein